MSNIRENLKLCKFMQSWGVFKCDRSESLAHNLAMARQFTILSYEGFAVAVRPILLSGMIPDLLILDTPHPIAKEIMVSESVERFKKKDYKGIHKIQVRVKNDKTKRKQK